MNNMTKTSTRDISAIESIEVPHDESCCVGCKIEGFIADLKKSEHNTDRQLGDRFQAALDRFNYEQEQAKRPQRRGC